MNIFLTYFQELKNEDVSRITEHSHRGKLEILLNGVASDINKKIKILHEPRTQGKFGRPDFLVKNVENIIGFIENKKIGEDLTDILQSEQIKKYAQLSDNILLTNYLDWVWIRKGKAEITAKLGDKFDLLNKKFQPAAADIKAVESLIKHFFEGEPTGISSPKELAQKLAMRGSLLKNELLEELQKQETEHHEGRLFGLYNTFRETVSNELTLPEFADAFSQMLIYGLFLAKLNADIQQVTLKNTEDFIPESFSLIRELVSFLGELNKKEYADTRWIIEEVLTILNTMNLGDIQQQLTWSKTQLKDPYIYFYEDFLGAYDARLRKAKGVYYTPPPVVNFIVRAINDILKDTFEISDGLANREKVTVLDFATGTGTFLLEIMQQILESLPPNSPKRNAIIGTHLLKNLYGFEYMIAPYTIAHLKLSQFLKEQGYKFEGDDRLQIFLTNTLEYKPTVQGSAFLPSLTQEGKHAQTVKEKQPILIITGNPPYSGHSKNNGAWIKDKIQTYFYVDGKPLGEKNPKWLQDDYVKFFRFAQYKMEQVTEGMVAIITNHSFLDNPTFRGMRQSLMQTFDQLYFLDLHGNAKKKEKNLDGSKDENVFDIEQGVAISILIKRKGLEKGVFVADFYGKREEKYAACLESKFRKTAFKKINVTAPFYLFQEQNEDLKAVYEKFWSVNEIFKVNGVGIVTAKDAVLIGNTKEELIKQVETHFQIKTNIDYIKKIDYRPFDNRFVYYDTKIVERARENVMKNMFSENLSIVTSRQAGVIGSEYFDAVFINKFIGEFNFFRRGGITVFPLYLYETQHMGGLFSGEGESKTENFTKEFRAYFNGLFEVKYSPEQILGYIYAILHSPTYRKKYTEFLKIDFPRIPFCEDFMVFEKLSNLGTALIQKHLLKEIPNTTTGGEPLGEWQGEDLKVVEKPIWAENKLYFNPKSYFNNVPQAVYEFQIGGYQVLDKYLKDRKGRELSLDEIENIEKIIKVLQFTIVTMAAIDELTKDWI